MKISTSQTFAFLCCLIVASGGCIGQTHNESSQLSQEANSRDSAARSRESNSPQTADENRGAAKMEKATLGAGCFWCVEAVFQQLDGVTSVQAGYMGGSIENPTYSQVCSGTTGHAEICHLEYDANKITFDELLEVFWKTHDPTTRNRQGNDYGTQYRSVIFYYNAEQKEKAETIKKKLNDEKTFPNPVVTEITPASQLFIAENYHQDYFKNNPDHPYCRAWIPPKLEKLRKVFGDKLKKGPAN